MLSGNSDLVISVGREQLHSGVDVDAIELAGGQVVAISSDAITIYRDRPSLDNPFGNGILDTQGIPAGLEDFDGRVEEYRAGYVGLSSGYVLLLGGYDVRLFASKADALYNRNELLRAKFS